MICCTGLDLLQSRGEFPCAVCRTGEGSNRIFCNGCKHWVHKKCSGLKHLTKDTDYRCTRCQETARPLDGRPQRKVQVRPDKLEMVASFCYLGDMLSAAGGCVGWSGGAKVLCILHHWGVQLILAYTWARPAILVVGKGRGGMFLFLLFLHFHSCSSFFPIPLFHLLYSLFYLFSPFLWETTQNDPQGLTCR